jgi:hypothetical protein
MSAEDMRRTLAFLLSEIPLYTFTLSMLGDAWLDHAPAPVPDLEILNP